MILLTGASGFLGRLILKELSSNNDVTTIGRSGSSNTICNLQKNIPKIISNFELVIHSAGKAHSVPYSDQEKQEFYNVNVRGTENLLKGIEQSTNLPKSFIFISSVAVYGKDTGTYIAEDTPLLAKDPYGESKIIAEKRIQNWCSKNSVICTILRLPLLAGCNPPGNLASMIKGINLGYYFNIAGGKAQKSMVLAEDIAKIIPIVANIGGIYNLTDRYHPTFSELSELIAQQLGKSKPLNIPKWIANLIAKAGDLVGSKELINSKKLSKITLDLTFDDSKAVATFGWNPTPVLSGFKIH